MARSRSPPSPPRRRSVPLPPREHHNRCSTPTLNPSHRRPLLGPRARSSRSGCSSAPRHRRGDPPPLVASWVPCCRSPLLMWSRGRARRRWKDLPHIQGKEPLDSSPPPPLRWFPQMPKGWLHGGRPPGPSLQEAAFTGLFWPPPIARCLSSTVAVMHRRPGDISLAECRPARSFEWSQ
jgi:hypothetical protein